MSLGRGQLLSILSLPTSILDSMFTLHWSGERNLGTKTHPDGLPVEGRLGLLGTVLRFRLPTLPVLWTCISEVLGAEVGVGRVVRTLIQQGQSLSALQEYRILTRLKTRLAAPKCLQECPCNSLVSGPWASTAPL